MTETSKTENKPKRPPHPYKCTIHNFWMRKGGCELCALARDKALVEQEKLIGSNKQEVVIKQV